jgi:hypothetical protein
MKKILSPSTFLLHKKDRPSAESSHTRWGLGKDYIAGVRLVMQRGYVEPRTSWQKIEMQN